MCIQNTYFFICDLTISDPTCAYLWYLLLNLIFYPRIGHNKSVLVFCNTTILTTSLIKMCYYSSYASSAGFYQGRAQRLSAFVVFQEVCGPQIPRH